MSYDNTNTGALFKNDRKEDARHPDYKGSINIEGVEYWVSGWIKPTKADPEKRFMSLSFKPKEQRPPQRQHPRETTNARKPAPTQNGGGTGFDDMDDSIPF